MNVLTIVVAAVMDVSIMKDLTIVTVRLDMSSVMIKRIVWVSG